MAVDETTFGNTNADELSESELEQYGVWVKSAPENLDEDGDDSLQLEDFSVDELEDSARSFLGEEEEEESQQSSAFDEDVFDEVPVFSDEEEDLLAELERSGPSETEAGLDTELPGDDSFEFSGGKSYALDIEDSASDLSQPGQISEEFGAEQEGFDDIEQEFNAVEPGEDSFSMGEALGVPGEQDEFSGGDYPDLDDYPNLDLDSTSLPDDEESDDYDDIQIDLDHDSSIPELELDEPTDQGVADLTPDEEQLLRDAEDSVEATEKDDEMDQAAYRLLEQIQGEIASIKEDLHELREDVADIRASRAMGTPVTAGTATDAEPKVQGSEEGSGLLDPGFFEEDEDETIALTGDELDNILNTADFVETTGEPTPVDDSLHESPEAGLELDEIDLEETDLESDFDVSFEQETPESAEVLDEELPQEDIIPMDLEDSDSETVDFDVSDLDDDDEITIDLADSDEPETAAIADDEQDIEIGDDLDLGDLESELDELESEDISLPVEPSAEDSTEAPIEEISIDDEFDMMEEEAESDETPAGFPGDDEAALEVETPPTDTSEIDTLAQLDIDSELADIEDLKDSPDDTVADTSEIDDISIAFPDEDESETPAEDVETGLDIDEDEFEIDDELDLEEDTLELEEDELEEDELGEVEASDDELEEEELGDVEITDDELEEDTDTEPAFTAHSLTDTMAAAQEAAENDSELSEDLREEIRAVLRYMDQLLESLPEDKIQEFASSEHFEVYKKLFEELGLET